MNTDSETKEGGQENGMAGEPKGAVKAEGVTTRGLFDPAGNFTFSAGTPLRFIVEGGGSPLKTAVDLNVPQPVELNTHSELVGNLEYPIAVQAKMGADIAAKADINANAKVDADIAAKADVNANAKVDADIAAKADINANAKVDADIAAKADVNANAKVDANANVNTHLGGTGTPLAVQLQLQLPKGHIHFNLHKVGFVFKLFGFKIFEFGVELDAHMHMDPDGGHQNP